MAALLELLRDRDLGHVLGIALAAVCSCWLGPYGARWASGFCLVVALVDPRGSRPPSRARKPRAPRPRNRPSAILSPLVRRVLGQMPVPVMLLDESARSAVRQ